MIKIINRQRKIKIDTKKIKSNIQKILNFLGYNDFDIGVLFTTNQTIRKYNKKYRGKDESTDILSFSYYTSLKPNQKIKIKNPEDKNLGDIIISLERVMSDSRLCRGFGGQAKKTVDRPELVEGSNRTIVLSKFKEHLNLILVHGIAHLLGHDHKTEKQYKIMRQFENKLLGVIK